MSGSRPRVLVVSDRRPVDLAHGRDLRIHHLVSELARDFECLALDLSAENTGDAAVPGNAAVEYRSLPARPMGRDNVLRHLRWSDAGFPRRAHPEFYRDTVAAIGGIADEFQPTVILNFSRFAAELIAELGRPAILDWSDSASLSLDRAMAARAGPGRGVLGLGARLRRHRAAGRERYLVRRYPAVTTISGQERDHLLRVSGVPGDRVLVIPNGASRAALDGFREGPRERAVVFWGNLDFPPNWTAVRYFYEQVFRDRLAPEGVGFHVIGRGGDAPLGEVFRDPRVTRHGFVDDLYELLGGLAVMVNPMVQGGGMKNKVLEAFACGIPVVSTTLGLDGIDAEPGVQCRTADDPAGFADATLGLLNDRQCADTQARAARALVEERYIWPRSADLLRGIIGGLAGGPDALSGRAPPVLPARASAEISRETSG